MNETDQDLERFLIAEYKVLTEMTFADVDEAAANVEAAQRAYEAAKKTAATAKRKDVTKQLFEDDAGTSDERAGDAYAKARRDCAAASEAACGAALVQNARAFHGLFLAFGRALASGQTVVSDMEPWDQELAHQVAGLAEESSAAAAQQNPQEALDALLEKEEQYGGVLAALVELQKRLVAEPALRFSSLDARHIFGSVAQLAAVHADLAAQLRAARAGGDIAQAVAGAVHAQLPMLERLYVPYIEQLGLALQTLERTKKASGRFAKFLKAWKKRTPSVGTVPFDLPTLLLLPSHPLYKVSNCLRALLNETDPSRASWVSLQETVDDLGDLLEALDQAKQQSEQMKRLESLSAKLPDEKLVQSGRSFVLDGTLTVISDTFTGDAAAGSGTGADSSQKKKLPPLLPGSPAAIARSAGNSGGSNSGGNNNGGDENALLIPKQQYRVFLFNDVLLVAPVPRRGEAADVYRVCCRFKVDTLVVSGGRKTSFLVDSPGRSTLWEAPSAECCAQWCAVCGRAVAERAKTVVFGAPLADVMRRPAERNRVVPSFLQRAVECVEQSGLATEGIFRLSSEAAEFTRICKALDAGRRPLFTDPLDAANFIKAWLRALPEPLLTHALRATWTAAVETGRPSLAECVQALPPANRNVLEVVMHVLREVADRADVNKMTAKNLATLVGVGILESPAENPFSGTGSVVVELLITHYDEAFAPMKAAALANDDSVSPAPQTSASPAAGGASGGAASAVSGANGGEGTETGLSEDTTALCKRYNVAQIEKRNRLRRLATLRKSRCFSPSAVAGVVPPVAAPVAAAPVAAPVALSGTASPGPSSPAPVPRAPLSLTPAPAVVVRPRPPPPPPPRRM